MNKPILILLLLAAFCLANFPVKGNELSGIKMATESGEYERLKDVYRQCMLTRGHDFLQVASIDSVIEHVPMACRRELLKVRQFLLSGAFKVEVIDQLIESVEEGAKIDLVNAVFNETLKRRGLKE